MPENSRSCSLLKDHVCGSPKLEPQDPFTRSFGTTKRNQYYGPGFGSVDFSIFKNTPITERISTQFRVEIFNFFNRLNLGGPSNDVAGGSGNGLIYGSRHGGDAPGIGSGEPRNLQLAMKIIW